MKFIGSTRNTKSPQNFNMHMIITGFFIGLSYVLALLPLSLFAIAQTLAIFGKKTAALLCGAVVLVLCGLAIITGFSPLVLGALFAFVSVPLFLCVSILRQKKTSIFWSFSILFLPIVLFFGTIISTPVFNADEYDAQLKKIEISLSHAQTQNQNTLKNAHVYEKAIEQIEIVRKDSVLRNFMGFNAYQRIIYFIYDNGFSILFGFLLSFFAALFFLDFAFEQIEKLKAVSRYVRSLSSSSFDVLFLALLKSVTDTKNVKGSDEDESKTDFNIIKHSKLHDENASQKRHFFGLLRAPRPENTISFRDYIFYYTGKAPGWNLGTYQIPLIFCVLSIIVLCGTVFYFGNVQNIIIAVQTQGIRSGLIVVSSALSIFALSFLVLQGIFTLLKWVPFGIVVFISLVFLLISPYIMVDMGPFLFLSMFGIIGLLGYLK